MPRTRRSLRQELTVALAGLLLAACVRTTLQAHALATARSGQAHAIGCLRTGSGLAVCFGNDLIAHVEFSIGRLKNAN